MKRLLSMDTVRHTSTISLALWKWFWALPSFSINCIVLDSHIKTNQFPCHATWFNQVIYWWKSLPSIESLIVFLRILRPLKSIRCIFTSVFLFLSMKGVSYACALFKQLPCRDIEGEIPFPSRAAGIPDGYSGNLDWSGLSLTDGCFHSAIPSAF